MVRGCWAKHGRNAGHDMQQAATYNFLKGGIPIDDILIALRLHG